MISRAYPDECKGRSKSDDVQIVKLTNAVLVHLGIVKRQDRLVRVIRYIIKFSLTHDLYVAILS